MIDTTIAALITVKPLLQQLANIPMPARESFLLLRTLKTIDNEYLTVEKTRNQLLTLYGSQDEQGNFIINPDNTSKFQEEINNLLETNITIDCEPISIELFEDIKISPSQMSLIEPFIKL